jgi:PhnB protein
MSLHPYLFFSGTCREAMTHYQSVLGGQLDVMTYGQLPPSEEPPPFEVDRDTVMHAALSFGDGDLLLASDDPTGDGAGVRGASMNITLTDQDEARRIFEALADGGEIGMPLEATFWSPLFGTCTDRFGVSWMVNIDGEPQGS